MYGHDNIWLDLGYDHDNIVSYHVKVGNLFYGLPMIEQAQPNSNFN